MPNQSHGGASHTVEMESLSDVLVQNDAQQFQEWE